MRSSAFLGFATRLVAISYPSEISGEIERALGLKVSEGLAMPDAHIAISTVGLDRYRVEMNGAEVWANLALGDAINVTLIEAQRVLLGGFPSQSVVVHAASIVSEGRAILIPGPSQSGKSTLSAWFASRGLSVLSDDVSAIAVDGSLCAIYRPMTVRDDVWEQISTYDWVSESFPLAGGRRLVTLPKRPDGEGLSHPCRLILVPDFVAGSEPLLTRLGPAQMTKFLMAQNYSARELADHGMGAALGFARIVPAVQVRYGALSQLGEIFDTFIRKVLAEAIDRAGFTDLIASANAEFAAAKPAAAPLPPAIPAATPRNPPKKLTIGMATYDDYDGVYFTLQSLRLYHAEAMADAEFIVIDNNPSGPAAPHLKALEGAIPNFRYVPFGDNSGTAASRSRIFSEASGEFVVCMDCHVLVPPGAVSALLTYFAQNPGTNDLLQGPLLYDNLRSIASHWKPVWSAGMLGQWAQDNRADDILAEPFDIPMQGLGLFACRLAAWQGFNDGFRGFGGEEGYLHEKFRQAGARTLCLPFLRWVHRFARPGGVPYRNSWDDRIHNYLLGHTELGLPTDEMEAHFEQHLGLEVSRRIFAAARAELGIVEPATRNARLLA